MTPSYTDTFLILKIMQNEIHRLKNWADKWLLKLNVDNSNQPEITDAGVNTSMSASLCPCFF